LASLAKQLQNDTELATKLIDASFDLNQVLN